MIVISQKSLKLDKFAKQLNNSRTILGTVLINDGSELIVGGFHISPQHD